MQPMNYMIDVKNPFDNAVSGISAGLQISNAMDKAQQQQLALQQMKQMQLDLGALSQKQNPTAQDFAAITTKYPQLAEHFKNTWSMLNQDQQQARLGQASQIYAALNAGKPDIAAQLADEQAAAFTNSGRPDDAKTMSTLSQLIKASPETARTSTGLLLSSVLGPEKFTNTFTSLEKLPSDIAKTNADVRQIDSNIGKNSAEIRNIDSQITNRAGQLSLDRDKLESETKLKLYELQQKNNTLDDQGRKLVNDSVISSVSADQSAGQILDLAGRLEKEGGGYGAFGTASEWLKKATGNQDSMTQMRNEYVRIRNSQAMKMLPPGSASDKDVAMAMGGFPPETADAKTMASFLRGMAKLNQYTAVAENAKAEWVNSVGHLGKAKTDITIDGTAVPAGTTFTDFARTYLAAKTQQRAATQDQQNLGSRSYMRWAQPQGQQ